MKPINVDSTCQKNVMVLFLMPVTYLELNDFTNYDFPLIRSKLGWIMKEISGFLYVHQITSVYLIDVTLKLWKWAEAAGTGLIDLTEPFHSYLLQVLKWN